MTTRELIVRGRVARTAGEVRIMLESSGGKPIATAAIDPTGFGHGDWIPFESRFRLAIPRPGGDMTLFLVVVDGDGIPIDAIRRRFTIGAIVDIPGGAIVPSDRSLPIQRGGRAHGRDPVRDELPAGFLTLRSRDRWAAR